MTVIEKPEDYNIINDLQVIDNEVKNCKICSEVESFIYSTISIGKNKNLLFIGESPAKNGWVRSGRAFTNPKGEIVPTGKVLEKLLLIIGLKLEDVTFTEAVKCFVPNRKLLKRYSENCKNILNKQISLLKPKLIIPLGEHPTKVLIGNAIKFKNFGEVVGKVQYIYIENEKYIVYPIYHPSPISPKSYKYNITIFENLKKIIDKF